MNRWFYKGIWVDSDGSGRRRKANAIRPKVLPSHRRMRLIAYRS